jgi:hypothetical protein
VARHGRRTSWDAPSAKISAADRGNTPPLIAENGTNAPASTAPDTSVEAPPSAAVTLAVAPPSHDYGVIRKGTRATRQFEIANNSNDPMSIQVARSTCRCLYYEHAPVIPPKQKNRSPSRSTAPRPKPEH